MTSSTDPRDVASAGRGSGMRAIDLDRTQGGHAAAPHESDGPLCDAVAELIGAGLAGGDSVVILVTPAHREALEARLEAGAIGAEDACERGHLTFLDAAETLASIMVGDMPDWDRFVARLTPVFEASKRARPARTSARVRAFGEMAELLRKQRNPRAAIRLEEMWSTFAARHSLARAFEGEVVQRRELEDAQRETLSSLRRSEGELTLKKRELEDTVLKLKVVLSELETANRMKDEFLATVSHELRTPLNAILGWVRMLRSGTLPEEKRPRALETIERNAHAQTRLIEDLLDISRIISGKMRLEVRSVDLPAAVRNAIDTVRPAAEAKGVTLHQTMDPDATPILGDCDRIQQIVWNLLTNAVRFTPKGGTIHVVLRKRESSVDIVVADTGQGIDAQFLPQVFERFRQADATTMRKHGGLGLGLAIVRHLVELHGGTARVESGGPGMGATFTVSFPISPLRASTFERPPALRLASSPHDIPRPHELEGVRILVVDDEVDARELVAELLASCKAVVFTAGNVDEALRVVQERRPDVVVSDIGMPGEDGYALIKRLRALPAEAGGRTPAVALTAYARFEDRTKALVAGFNMHVPKPVEATELLAVLASLATLFPRA